MNMLEHQIHEMKKEDTRYGEHNKFQKVVKIKRHKNHQHLAGYTLEQLEALADEDYLD